MCCRDLGRSIMMFRSCRTCGCQLTVVGVIKAIYTFMQQVYTMTMPLCKMRLQSVSYNGHDMYVSMSALHFEAEESRVNKKGLVIDKIGTGLGLTPP